MTSLSWVSRPVMVDLFCGRFGWSKGFVAHGWHCIGIDLVRPEVIPDGCEFIQADIAHLVELPPADFYCCSSPCEQFSVHGMKHFHPNPKWPWLGIALFRRAQELIEATGKPYVMENVRAAQKFVGKNDYQFGPFSLWGNCFASMWPWPRELRWTKKAEGYKAKYQPTAEMQRRGLKTEMFHVRSSMPQKSRASIMAEIPFALSSHIAQMAGTL